MTLDKEQNVKEKKKSARNKKPVGFSQNEVDQLVEQARRDAAREAEERVRTEYEYEDPTRDEGESLFSQETVEIPVTDEEDFFDFIEQNYVNRGVGVSYYIQKDGMFQKEMRHPLSWAKIQSMFGGGHYKVTAKKADNKQYIKSKVMDVAELDGPRGTENNSSPAPVVVQTPAPQQNQSLDPNFLVELVAKIAESNRKDDKQAEKEEIKAQSNIMTTILTTQQQSQQQITDLIFKMQQSTMEVIKAANESTQKMVDSMRQEITRVLEAANKKKDGDVDQFKMMEMLQKAEDRGFDRMKMILDLAEDMKEEKSEDSSSSSMIGSLVKGVVPLLTTVNTQMQQQALPPQALPPAQPVRRPPPQVFRESTAGSRPSAPAIQPSRRIPQSPTQKAAAPIRRPHSPTAAIRPQVVESAPVKDKTLEELMSEATPLQTRFVETVLPLIAAPMQMGQPPSVAARHVFSEIEKQKDPEITPEALLKELPFDTSRQIAVAFGMNSQDQIQWLKEFYAYFKTAADAQSTLSQQLNGSNEPSSRSNNRGGEAGQSANS